MSDLIERQAAIDIVKGYAEQLQGYIGMPNDSEVYAYARELLLSIDRNIKALQSAQPEIAKDINVLNNDCISRQAVIDALEDWFFNTDDSRQPEEVLRCLPSAQPEIIHCKDCKHRDPEDKKCDSGHSIQWQLPRDDNWFCADAKRRTDE